MKKLLTMQSLVLQIWWGCNLYLCLLLFRILRTFALLFVAIQCGHLVATESELLIVKTYPTTSCAKSGLLGSNGCNIAYFSNSGKFRNCVLGTAPRSIESSAGAKLRTWQLISSNYAGAPTRWPPPSSFAAHIVGYSFCRFNTACVASCVPYFGICYLLYCPCWLPCYACFALSQVFRKCRPVLKSRMGLFVANVLYLLSVGIGLSFKFSTRILCPRRTCFGARTGCGPECAQVHRGGRYYTNYGLKSEGYEEYCLVCEQGWDSHSGIAPFSSHAIYIVIRVWFQDPCTTLATMDREEAFLDGRIWSFSCTIA